MGKIDAGLTSAWDLAISSRRSWTAFSLPRFSSKVPSCRSRTAASNAASAAVVVAASDNF